VIIYAEGDIVGGKTARKKSVNIYRAISFEKQDWIMM
jgi:hypothetical protein